jgi:AraC-like DNA-binding protein
LAVARSRTTAASHPPSTIGGLVRLAYARAVASGVKLDPLLKKAGLTKQQIRDRGGRIPTRDQIRFVNLIAEALGDDCLGFHLAHDFELRAFGLYYYVLASSGTFLEALQRGVRYTAIINEGMRPTCTVGKEIRLAYHYVGISRHLDRHQIEFRMAALVRLFRQLTRTRLQPIRVRFTHHRNEVPADFAEVFGRNVEFSAAVDEITFKKKDGQLPLTSADPYLSGVLLDHCEQMLSRRRGSQPTFHSRVENAVGPLLPRGKAQAGNVARELGVSSRTFARRLAAEGLTFSGVVQKLRSDLASRYLADDKLSISQIAWMLGYREVAAFSHAYKRQTGKTPREARTQIGNPTLTRRA